MNQLPTTRLPRTTSRYPYRIEVRVTRYERQKIAEQARATRRSISRYLAEVGTHTKPLISSERSSQEGEASLYELKRVAMDLEALVFATRQQRNGGEGRPVMLGEEILTILRRVNAVLHQVRRRWMR